MSKQGSPFLARMLRAAVIACILLFYQSHIQQKTAEAKILTAQAEASQAKEQYQSLVDKLDTMKAEKEGETETQDESEEGYPDGSFAGEGTGFGGTIQVEVTIQGGAIQKIEVLSAEKEDSAYLEMAKEVTQRVVEAQSTQVDTVSGATFSSKGILEAVEQALEKAVGQ